jgi:hypothetical protein
MHMTPWRGWVTHAIKVRSRLLMHSNRHRPQTKSVGLRDVANVFCGFHHRALLLREAANFVVGCAVMRQFVMVDVVLEQRCDASKCVGQSLELSCLYVGKTFCVSKDSDCEDVRKSR